MSDLATDRTSILSALDPGDALATSGSWLAAIDAWDAAVQRDPALRTAVERRLAWLLTETGQRSRGQARIRLLLLAFIVACLLATSFLALAGTAGTSSANAWAVATWVMVAIASIAAVVAARWSGEPSLGHRIAQARRAATMLEYPDATGDRHEPT